MFVIVSDNLISPEQIVGNNSAAAAAVYCCRVQMFESLVLRESII